METVNWVTSNWIGIGLVISGGINLFSAIAALTKTKRDDEIADYLKNATLRFLSIK